MNQTVSSGTTPNSPEEVRALAWVADEVRRSLESGHKVLHRYLREAEALVGSDVDHVDPTVLRNARTHFHQAAGALELVGMAVPAQTMRASEKAIQRLAERPANLTPKAVETIERASFALLDYIGRLTAGKPVSGVALFPQYQGLLELAGADRIHPADLWDHDWAWRSIERDPEAHFVEPDDAARDAMERLILRVMRSPDRQTMRRMSDLCAGLGAEAKGRRETLWRLAAGFFEALAAGLLRLDMHVKRLAPRLLAQARLGLRSSDVSDRLARDLLFFCARSRVPEQEQQAPRLMAVRRAYRLEGPELPDYDTPSLGRFDPTVLAQARRRLAAAREAWNAMAGGEPHRAQNLPDSFSLVQDSLELLYPDGAELGQSLMAAVHAVGPTVVAPPLAMEVATAILYLEASLENAEFDDPQLASRVRRLAARIDAVRQGSEPPPLDSWMEELYRQVSDMQTIGSVVQELRGSFGEIEKQLDHYFREPADREVLQAVPGQLMSLRGVLSVLGLDAATQAVLRMREDVERLAQGAAAPAEGPGGQAVLERLADNLGALTFLIDMLAVQPQLAKRLFRFDAETGHLRALMAVPPGRDSGFSDPMSDSGPGDLSERTRRIGQQAERPDVSDEALLGEMRSLAQQAMLAEERRLADTLTAARNALEQATDAEQRRTLRAELAAHMHQLGGAPEPALPAAADVPAAALAPAGPPSGSAMAAAPAPASFDAEAGDDGEVLAVFLEEATEVIALARESLQRLQTEAHDADDDLPQMTAVRRAFHTLKGSSRMVGLAEFGEAAWSCEQLYNSRLAQSARMEPGLHAFTQQALDYLGDWTAAISQGHNGGHRKLEISAAADALRLEGRAIDLPLPAAAAQQPQATAQVREETIEAAAPALPEVPVEAPREAADDLASQGTGAEQLPIAATDTEPVALPAWPTVQPLEVDWPSLPDLELRADEAPAVPNAGSTPEPAAAAPAAEPVLVPDDAAPAEEAFKVVGPLRIEIGMFNVFLNEADERSRLLSTQLAEWALDPKGPPGDAVAVAAHALAGSSATIGFTALSSLARALERALARSNEAKGLPSQEPVLFGEAADNVQRLLHQFAAGFIEAPRAGLVERLDAYQPKAPAAQLPTAVTEEPFWYEDDDIDAVDTVDADLFPVFSEEADELLPRLQGHMRGWAAQPLDRGAAAACMRDLHTFKGGARLAGAMRLGEMAHRMETAVEQLLARGSIIVSDVESLTARADGIEAAFEALRTRHAAAPATAAPLVQAAAKPGPVPAPAVLPAAAAAAAAFCDGEGGEPRVLDPIERIDWARFASAARSMAPDEAGALAAGGGVRVRSSLLDRLVNHAGEVSIARTRIDADLALIKGSLGDLSENLDRLRRQLRDVEVQAESQINSRLEAAKAAAVEFDPLEMDRYTRVQELTRMMAESVNDVATVQRTLQRALQSSEDQVAQQGRLARSLQEDLLRTRMVEFESLSDRLYRVVRLAAKETGKQVRLDIVGGSIEIDRSVLERMTAPFEHLLRNAVTHGIERPELRQAAGKPAAGTIQIRLEPDGNEVAVEFADDGQGLDLARIRARAIEKGLLAAAAQPSDGALADLIFAPGFSTAETVTELAGRGVGMDVVRSEVLAMGGRVQTQTQPGQGTRFRMVLPLTTAVTQVVMLRCGDLRVAVPANLVEIVRREPAADVQAAYLRGQWSLGGESFPFHWLGALLGREPAGAVAGRTVPILVVRSAAQRVALHVDEVLGNQEVVVKNLGPQLSRLPGLSGLTLLPSGAVAAIYNPVALASVYGSAARRALQQTLLQSPDASGVGQATAAPQAPLVLVVDDSLTVRRVTQRLLTREGYRVTAAKDGLDALERVSEEMPSVILSDIEMPRMDGFDFVRSLRSEPATASVPIIMITSRIAQKHRDYAFELGVQHYLGKPYGEEELLRLVSKYARRGVAMASVSAVA